MAPNSVTGEHCTENISYNVFANSQGFYDVSLAYTNLTVGNNLFVNDVGPLFDCATIYDSSFEVHNNSFLNITGPVLKLWPGASGSFIDGVENYWGTTNSTIVASMIYDETVDVTCAGFIPYLPILTSPDPSTPTCVIASAGAGGSISPSGVVSVNYGGSQSFTITPNAGYHVTEVYVNGTSVGAVSSYAVQNIQGASTVSVTFATNTPTATPTPSPTPSPMVTPTAKPTPTSPTATPTLTPTQTPIATFSPSPTISFSPTLPSPNSPRLNDISSENKSFEAKIKEIAEIVVAALVVGWVAVTTVFARRRSAKISINGQVHLVELCKCLQAVAVSLLAGRFLTCLK